MMQHKNNGKEKDDETLSLLNSANERNYTETFPNPFTLLPKELVARIFLEAAGYHSTSKFDRNIYNNLKPLLLIDKETSKNLKEAFVRCGPNSIEHKINDLMPQVISLDKKIVKIQDSTTRKRYLQLENDPDCSRDTWFKVGLCASFSIMAILLTLIVGPIIFDKKNIAKVCY